MTDCLSLDIDRTKNLKRSEVGTDSVRNLGLHSAKESIWGGTSDKADSNSTGLEECFSFSSLPCLHCNKRQLCLLLEEL